MQVISQSQIPEQFNGLPLSEEIRARLSEVNAQYPLSNAEVNCILGWLMGLNIIRNESDGLVVRRDYISRIVDQLKSILDYARKTNTNILATPFQDLIKDVREYLSNEGFGAAFANCPQGMRQLHNASAVLKNALVELNAMIARADEGLNDKELLWIAKKAGSVFENNPSDTKIKLSTVIKWSRLTNTDLNTMNDLGTAYTLASEWQDYKRKFDLSRRLSENGIRTVSLSGNWKAVWIDPNAEARPSQEGSDTVANTTGSLEIDIEKEITGILPSTSDNLISVRDPKGVPHASIEIGAGEPGQISVYSIESTSSGRPKVKELVRKMAESNQKMWWANGEATPVDSVKDLTESVSDVYGIVPSIYINSIRVSVGNDKDSYGDALEWSYGEAHGGSSYYSSVANKCIEALAWYAEQRDELHLLEAARESFGEWAFDQWADAMPDIAAGDPKVPPRPDEDDEQFNHNGEFDSEAYAKAEKEYNNAMAPYEKYFEPNVFDQRAYEEINDRINKPENKPLYDRIKLEQEEARKRRELEIQEERKRKQQEEDERIAKEDRKSVDNTMMQMMLDKPKSTHDFQLMDPDDNMWTVGSSKKPTKIGCNFTINIAR